MGPIYIHKLPINRPSGRYVIYIYISYIYTNVLGRVRRVRARIRAFKSFTGFRCCSPKTRKNMCKCCTGATSRSKWPAPACLSAASALVGAVRACFSAAGALKMAALACPGAASALEKPDRACLGAASAIKMAALACSGVVSVLKEAVRACFGAASALKEAFRACCSKSLFAKAVLGYTVL